MTNDMVYENEIDRTGLYCAKVALGTAMYLSQDGQSNQQINEFYDSISLSLRFFRHGDFRHMSSQSEKKDFRPDKCNYRILKIR
jgi:hypothetical protein